MTETPEQTPEPRRSRRSLLRWFGLGAAGYAAGAVTMARDAKAADGDAITAGNTTAASTSTKLSQTGAIRNDGAFVVEAPDADWGIEGDSGQIGVLGDGYFGVVGTGTVGAFFSGALAALSLQPQAAAGAPTSGDYSRGDMIVDAAGELYLCRVAGNPGTWTHVSGSGGGGGGGGLTFLDTPTRFYDSRETGGLFQMNETRDVTIAGVHGVPSNATGVIGNLAITGTTRSGNAVIYPTGKTLPLAANINWFAAKQTLSNQFAVPLGVGGAVTLFAAEPVQMVVDINAYLL